VGEKCPVILPKCRLMRYICASFTCPKSTTWDRRLYFPTEGRRAEDFFCSKNPMASAGSEPVNLGTKGKHATSRPPKPQLVPMLGTQLTKNVLSLSLSFGRIAMCHVYKNTGLKFILRVFNLFQIIVYCFSNIYFNVILPDVLRFSNRFFHCYGLAAHSSHTFMRAACLRQSILLVQKRNIQLYMPLFYDTYRSARLHVSAQ